MHLYLVAKPHQIVRMERMKMRYILYCIAGIPLVAYAAYFVIMGMMTFVKSSNPIKSARAQEKFAVVIPARNEEMVIAKLIETLKAQNYPLALYDIYVAANNCTDNTAQVALDCGVNLIPIEGEIKSKGDVMIQVFDFVSQRPDYDATLVFDADNLVHPDFFQHMNDALSAGYQVAEGNRDSKNPGDSWISGNTSIYYWLLNVFVHRARMNIGASACLNGTGMMISQKAIAKMGFDIKTLTEDIEFSTICALNNEPIAFVEKAVFYDEQPNDLHSSLKQRKRWSVGCYECVKHYGKPLIKKMFTKPSFAATDMALIIFAPFIQVVFFLLSAVMFLDMCFGMYPTMISGMFLISFGLISGAMSYLAQVCLALWGCVLHKKNIRAIFPAAMLFPVFVMTWIPINIVCLIHPKTTWEPIKHDRVLTLDKLNEENAKHEAL